MQIVRFSYTFSKLLKSSNDLDALNDVRKVVLGDLRSPIYILSMHTNKYSKVKGYFNGYTNKVLKSDRDEKWASSQGHEILQLFKARGTFELVRRARDEKLDVVHLNPSTSRPNSFFLSLPTTCVNKERDYWRLVLSDVESVYFEGRQYSHTSHLVTNVLEGFFRIGTEFLHIYDSYLFDVNEEIEGVPAFILVTSGGAESKKVVVSVRYTLDASGSLIRQGVSVKRI